MDGDQGENSYTSQNPSDVESRSAVNSLILDYYKKFGRKRDLEQYFSLSTAQSDIRDPSSLFWAKMKAENESSDSGERSYKKSESSQEICRISIRFPAQEPCSSQDEETKTKTESVSPPIIIEELPHDSRPNSDDEAMRTDDDGKSDDDAKSDDNHSQKSYDILLDTSLNKLHSPSSSITSQRKLEWDSLADVGYANESDRKTSASSLSTLERLALKQQYSNNDTQQNSNLGAPTAQSTPLDENETKSKIKKGVGKKSTKIYKKDVDVVEVNVPHSSNMNPGQSINVNLTKHISFNVEKDGKVTIDNMQKDISVSPEKQCPAIEISPTLRIDRDVQTSLPKVTSNIPENNLMQQKIPVLISLNTLKSRVRRRRLRMARRKQKTKKRQDKENIPVQEKSGEQLSEAESFEYMPGHIYNQNQMTANNNNNRPNISDNKSSLESSGILTSDSSKGSQHSFTKDLEKSIDLLKAALKKRCDDASLRKQLIQQVCQRLLNSQYRDDDSTTDFLSGLSFGSKKLGLGEPNNTTTSTSENNSAENTKRPKKSILRSDKFNAGSIASTSQSVPNLPIASNSEKLVTSNLVKRLTTTESDVSSKNNTSSDNGLTKTSSEELYKKYMQALKREEAYKKHLKDKEMFLKQKLVASDSAFKVPLRVDVKPSTANSRLKDLIHDLTRNNYDDGSGDASKLEGGPSSHSNFDRIISNKNQRSHSVFTLSSGNSDGQNKKPNLKKRLQCDLKDYSKPGTSKDAAKHYCCCPHHGNLKFADSSVQVNIKKACNLETCPEMQNKQDKKTLGSPRKLAKIIADNTTGNLEYVCLCDKNALQEAPDDFLIYKCSRLTNKGIQLQEASSKSSTEAYVQCNDDNNRNLGFSQCAQNKSSQTDMLTKMMNQLPNTLASVHNPALKESDVAPTTSVASVYESTRWIQTEISINPKIAEPTLSDINIVSDTDCARLISENCRLISKPSLTDLLSTQAVANSSTAISSSNKSTASSKGDSKSRNSNSIPLSNIEHIEHTEKFTIPIQGTNVTLMVSLGSEQTPNNPIQKATAMTTQGIGTERVKAIEQATSVLDECSRGVQANDDNKNEDLNTVGVSDLSQKLFLSGTQKPLAVNTCLKPKDAPFATYPARSPVNEERPLRRANTDVDKHHHVAFSSSVENNNLEPSRSYTKITPKCSQIRSTDSSINLHDTHVCTCGCNGKIENCKLECSERKFMVTNNMSCEHVISTHMYSEHDIRGNVDKNNEQYSQSSPRKCSLKKPLDCSASSYNAMSPEYTEKCTCGCGGARNRCKKSCKESTKREFGTQSTDEAAIQTLSGSHVEESATSNYFPANNKTCSCGCGGKIDKCNKRCPERAKTTDVQSETGPCISENRIPAKKSTASDYFQKKNNSCSCGCGGAIDTCKKSCAERTKTTDAQAETGPCIPENEIPNLKSLSSSYSQNKTCSCGCRGIIDKCKKSCPERAKSMNIQTETVPCISEMTLLPSFVKLTSDREIDTQTDMYLNRRYSSPRRESHIPQDRRGSSPGRVESRIPQYRRASSPKQEENRISLSRRLSSPRKEPNHIPQYRRLSSPLQKYQEENRSRKNSRESSPTLAGNRNLLSGRDSSPRKQEHKFPQYRRPSSPTQRNESPRQIMKNHSDAQTSSEITGNKGCKRRPLENDMNTQTDPFDPNYEKCLCGCGNVKSSCKGSCPEKKTSQRSEDVKNIQTQPLLPDLNIESGCSTYKCGEPLTLREPQNVIANTAQGFPDSYKESCTCGCGHTKDKCSKACKASKSSPRDEIGKEIGIQKDREDSPPTSSRGKRSAVSLPLNAEIKSGVGSSDPAEASSKGKKSTTDTTDLDSGSDPIINMIQNITKKYAKKDVEKNKRKKCFKEIMTVLNYLLETEDDPGEGSKDKKNSFVSTTSNDETDACVKKTPDKDKLSKKVDRGVQPPSKKKPKQCYCSESSEVITSTEMPVTSSDSATCKVLNKIKKECDKYHQRRCKIHCGKNCDGTSSTSNCDKCRRAHQCQCRSQKCKNHKKLNEKIPKTSVAYNLILQTSESMMSDGPSSCCEKTQLQNIIVKVPKKKLPACMPFGEIAAKFERKMPPCNVHCSGPKDRTYRSKSCPNESEISSMDEILKKSQGATVREYLERNRPDFIEKCNERQTCMRYISESRCEDPKAPTRLKMIIVHTPNCTGSCNPFYAGVRNSQLPCNSTQCFSPRIVNVETEVSRIATERAAKRDLLSMHLAQLPDVTEMEGEDLRRLASELGRYMRHKQPSPKFINEREMKKRSEKIYKSLPEVIQKKEEQKKESIKKTNLLMANIFKKNLQKKTLRGSVNISNYSSVIKI